MLVFYQLLKIYKPGFSPKGWLIVSAQGSLLEPISQYVDSLLKLFVRMILSYLEDTRDSINKIEGIHVPPTALIFSLDVVSLYMSIPHDNVRSTIQDDLNKIINLHPPTHFILDLVDFLLEKNYFRYNEEYYKLQ